MRIAFLTPEYVSEAKFDGGLANYIFRVTRLLHEEGHEPEVFVTAERDESFYHQGILVHRCAPSRTMLRLDHIQRRILRRPWLSYMDTLMTAQALARRLSARHRRQPFDLIEASNFKATGLLVRPLWRPAMVTRISYRAELLDSASGRSRDIDRALCYLFEDFCARRSERVYGPCTRMAALVSERIGREVKVIHPPLFRSVDVTAEDDSVWNDHLRDIRYILFFGRICKVKGVDVLARAMRLVLEDTPGLHLAMVGRPESEAIMADVREALDDQEHKLIHLNRLPHAQLFPIIRKAEFVVLPSRADNFPNVCVEAMLQGQLVVGTWDTGFEDLIIDGENGLLARPDDVPDLVSQIRRVLRMSTGEKSKLRSAALRRVEGMEPDGAIREVLRCYEEARACRDTRLPERRGRQDRAD